MYSNLYSFLNIFIYRQQIPISKPTVMPPNSLKMKRYEFYNQNFHIIYFFIYPPNISLITIVNGIIILCFYLQFDHYEDDSDNGEDIQLSENEMV